MNRAFPSRQRLANGWLKSEIAILRETNKHWQVGKVSGRITSLSQSDLAEKGFKRSLGSVKAKRLLLGLADKYASKMPAVAARWWARVEPNLNLQLRRKFASLSRTEQADKVKDILARLGVEKGRRLCENIVKELFPKTSQKTFRKPGLDESARALAEEVRARYGKSPNRALMASELRSVMKKVGAYHSTGQCEKYFQRIWPDDISIVFWTREEGAIAEEVERTNRSVSIAKLNSVLQKELHARLQSDKNLKSCMGKLDRIRRGSHWQHESGEAAEANQSW